jgi:hypothetical protein
VVETGESCDDGLDSGATGVRDTADDFDSCPNGPGTFAFQVACRVTQTCGDALPFLIDSSSRCDGLGCVAPPLEQCDNGGGFAIIDGAPVQAPKTCFGFLNITGDQWHFNLDTTAAAMSKGIWKAVATLSDGSEHTVWIQLK